MLGIAVRKKYFGDGAERIVYRMTELDGMGQGTNGAGEAVTDSKQLRKELLEGTKLIAKLVDAEGGPKWGKMHHEVRWVA